MGVGQVVGALKSLHGQVKSTYSPKTQQKNDVQVSDSERHRSHQSQLYFEH